MTIELLPDNLVGRGCFDDRVSFSLWLIVIKLVLTPNLIERFRREDSTTVELLFGNFLGEAFTNRVFFTWIMVRKLVIIPNLTYVLGKEGSMAMQLPFDDSRGEALLEPNR